MIQDHNLLFLTLSLEILGGPDRSLLGLPQPVELLGVHSSACEPCLSAKVHCFHSAPNFAVNMLPFLWVRSAFLLGLALQKCCLCQCIYSLVWASVIAAIISFWPIILIQQSNEDGRLQGPEDILEGSILLYTLSNKCQWKKHKSENLV